MERAHNEHILALVDGVMAAEGLSAADLDGVAFGCGPGSFTGIRIAASVAQAIAFGAETRILPISSTLAQATAALEAGLPVGAGIVVSLRSRRDAYYLAAFTLTAGEAVPHRPDCLVTEHPGWPELQDGWTVVGDRPEWLAAEAACHSEVAVSAGLIARMGAAALAGGAGVAPEFGLPVYVSGDSPWKPASTGQRSRAQPPAKPSDAPS